MKTWHAIFMSLIFASSLASGAYAVSSQKHSITVDDQKREYFLYRPASVSAGTPAPLVIMMHGGFGSASQAEKAYGWDEQADKRGFVVAYPNGISHTWNAGGTCCGPAMKNKINDVGFITRVILDVSRQTAIDPKRVYLTGMSNGAVMSYRYACEGEYPVAAIGPVAGTFSFDCKSPRALSVMEIHGLQDNNVPFVGGQGSKGVAKVQWRPVPETIEKFRRAGNCAAPSIRKDGVVKYATSACANNDEVVLVTVANAGHQWPGSKKLGAMAMMLLPIDPPSTALDATSVLWTFFNQHPAH